MSKHGPTIEEEVREHACAIAQALGKYSDEMWRIGPWFMTIVLLARKLADQLVAGELDDRLKDIVEHHIYPGAGSDAVAGTVEGTWTMKTPAEVKL